MSAEELHQPHVSFVTFRKIIILHLDVEIICIHG